MKKQFDYTMPDFTKIRMIAQLNNMRAQLYAAQDIVGGDKCQDLIDHLQSEIDFIKEAQSFAIFGVEFTEVI